MQHAIIASGQQSFLMPTLREQLDPRHPLRVLAERIPWSTFEESFAELYSDLGAPAKPVRLMVSLLLLKQMFNLGDETVVARWVENPYWQFFSGFEEFQWQVPCDPSDLVYFRQRIAEAGAQLILAVSAQMHGRAAQEKTVVVDTTVQEKNITHPVDSKLHLRIIDHCRRLAGKASISLRRSYTRTIKALRWQLRAGTSRQAIRRARRAQRKIKTIAGRLVRELDRKLPAGHSEEKLQLYRRVLAQRRDDKDKIYSLHEPEVKCFGKGKVHKKYEFGNKVALVVGASSGVITAAESYTENLYDGRTLPTVLQQAEVNVGVRPEVALVDRGFRGARQIEGTQIIMPQDRQGTSSENKAQRRSRRRLAGRRASIEPRIGHLKSDFRLGRNYLRGIVGDAMNVMLACAASNLRKWMRSLARLCLQIVRLLQFAPPDTYLMAKPA
jgi:IS5 family transposase